MCLWLWLWLQLRVWLCGCDDVCTFRCSSRYNGRSLAIATLHFSLHRAQYTQRHTLHVVCKLDTHTTRYAACKHRSNAAPHKPTCLTAVAHTSLGLSMSSLSLAEACSSSTSAEDGNAPPCPNSWAIASPVRLWRRLSRPARGLRLVVVKRGCVPSCGGELSPEALALARQRWVTHKKGGGEERKRGEGRGVGHMGMV